MSEKLAANEELTASEALFGFVGWLTTREEKTVFSSIDDASIGVELIKQFCDENKLNSPREGWQNNLIHPSGECSGVSE